MPDYSQRVSFSTTTIKNKVLQAANDEPGISAIRLAACVPRVPAASVFAAVAELRRGGLLRGDVRLFPGAWTDEQVAAWRPPQRPPATAPEAAARTSGLLPAKAQRFNNRLKDLVAQPSQPSS